MTFPRLLKEGTAEERRLLGTALTDRPSKETQAQILSSLGLELGATPPTHSAAPAARPFGPLVQWVGIAGLAIGIGLGSAAVVRSYRSAALERRNFAEPGAIPSAALPESAAPARLTKTNPQEPERPKATNKLTAPLLTLPLPPPKNLPNRPSNGSSPSELQGLEVRLFDSARHALQTGNAKACLSALDERKRRVGTGMLEPESTLLRIQALLALNQTATAERDAHRYLRQHPEGHIATRIRDALPQLDHGQ